MKTVIFVILCVVLSQISSKQDKAPEAEAAKASPGTDSLMHEAGVKKLEEVIKDQITTLYTEKTKDDKIESQLKKERDSAYNAAELSCSDKKAKLKEIQAQEMDNLIKEYTEKLKIQANTKDLKAQNLRKIIDIESVDKDQKLEIEKQKGEKEILIRQQQETRELELNQNIELKETTAKLNQKLDEIKEDNEKLLLELKEDNKQEMQAAIKEAEKTLERVQEKFGVDEAEADEMKKKSREEFIEFIKATSSK